MKDELDRQGVSIQLTRREFLQIKDWFNALSEENRESDPAFNLNLKLNAAGVAFERLDKQQGEK